MNKFLTIILFVYSLNLKGQAIHENNIEGFWIQEKNELQENQDSASGEETIYKYYTGELVIWIWYYEKTSQTESYKTNFGFYNDCELPIIDSLKREGTYYFEVDSADFADEETTKVNMQNSCGQINIFTDGKYTMMNIYYSSRQQYVTYKKIDAIPKNIQEHLQKKEIKYEKQ